jgi:hypothetical protein
MMGDINDAKIDADEVDLEFQQMTLKETLKAFKAIKIQTKKVERKLAELKWKLEEAERKREEAEGKLEEVEGKLEEVEGKLVEVAKKSILCYFEDGARLPLIEMVGNKSGPSTNLNHKPISNTILKTFGVIPIAPVDIQHCSTETSKIFSEKRFSASTESDIHAFVLSDMIDYTSLKYEGSDFLMQHHM